MKAPNKHSKQRDHNKYGIIKWFNSRGIVCNDIIKEVIYYFCERENFTMDKIEVEPAVTKFIQNRFGAFVAFATKYLKENNYVTNSK